MSESLSSRVRRFVEDGSLDGGNVGLDGEANSTGDDVSPSCCGGGVPGGRHPKGAARSLGRGLVTHQLA